MRNILVVLFALSCMCSCSLETEGLPGIPATWRAWVNCSGPEPMLLDTPIELPDDWQCVAHAPKGASAAVTCWRSDTEFQLLNSCRSRSEHSSAAVGGCIIQIACA